MERWVSLDGHTAAAAAAELWANSHLCYESPFVSSQNFAGMSRVPHVQRVLLLLQDGEEAARLRGGEDGDEAARYIRVTDDDNKDA